ncbi:hypothetical protein [Rothia amarae]|uniref:hypothetical protein n=1 Tax=Rothia amarae TaxID=169480 RepID=UPI0012462BEC
MNNKVWKSQRVIIGVVLLSSLFLGGCSVDNEKGSESKASSSSSSSTVDASVDVNKDFEQAVLGTVEASGVPAEQWYYTGGRQFGIEYFKGRVAHMGSYCGDSDDNEMLYRKSVVLKYEHTYSAEEYLKISDEMLEQWKSNNLEPYTVGSDGQSKKIAYQTSEGVLVQFYAGKTGLMILADTECNLPSPEPSPSAS